MGSFTQQRVLASRHFVACLRGFNFSLSPSFSLGLAGGCEAVNRFNRFIGDRPTLARMVLLRNPLKRFERFKLCALTPGYKTGR